jgi:hypothetical protein
MRRRPARVTSWLARTKLCQRMRTRDVVWCPRSKDKNWHGDLELLKGNHPGQVVLGGCMLPTLGAIADEGLA